MIITEPNVTLAGMFRLAVVILEIAGTLTILTGAGYASARFGKMLVRGEGREAFLPFRSALGRSILLGLEFLVAGDIVKSLVIDPTLDDLIVLAGLVLVRTFLSVSLGVEINGHWPWQETQMARARLRSCSTADQGSDTGRPSALDKEG